jgi:hypothetical protein
MRAIGDRELWLKQAADGQRTVGQIDGIIGLACKTRELRLWLQVCRRGALLGWLGGWHRS